jgi:hypothetical protein
MSFIFFLFFFSSFHQLSDFFSISCHFFFPSDSHFFSTIVLFLGLSITFMVVGTGVEFEGGVLYG